MVFDPHLWLVWNLGSHDWFSTRWKTKVLTISYRQVSITSTSSNIKVLPSPVDMLKVP